MENEISHNIIGAATEVHKVLGGPGLLESVYESCLCHELVLRGFKVQRQLIVPVHYKGSIVKDPLYLDILVDGMVIVEVKSTEKLYPIHELELSTDFKGFFAPLRLCVLFIAAQACPPKS